MVSIAAAQQPAAPAPAARTPPARSPPPATAPAAPAAAPRPRRHPAFRSGLDAGPGAAAGRPGQAVPRQSSSAAGDDGNDAMGLVQQRAAAGPARRFGRFDRLRDDDAFAQSGRARDDDRADQETADRLPGSRPAHVDGPGVHRGRRAGRCPQGAHQQDRAARLRHELQRARHVRRVSEQVSRGPGQVFLPRSRAQGRRVRARESRFRWRRFPAPSASPAPSPVNTARCRRDATPATSTSAT